MIATPSQQNTIENTFHSFLLAGLLVNPKPKLPHFFYLCKFISYQISVCHDPNCGKMYFNCSNVCEVMRGLLTAKGRHNWTVYTCLYFEYSSSVTTDNFALVMYWFFFFTFLSGFMAWGLIIQDSGRARSINLKCPGNLFLAPEDPKKYITLLELHHIPLDSYGTMCSVFKYYSTYEQLNKL